MWFPLPIELTASIYQHYVIKYVSNFRQVGGFLRVLRFPSTNKTARHDISEILLKVALSTTKPTNKLTKKQEG
jgi:hypothetical protein